MKPLTATRAEAALRAIRTAEREIATLGHVTETTFRALQRRVGRLRRTA